VKIAYVHSGLWPSNSPSTTFVTYNAVGLATTAESVHLFVKKKSHQSIEDILLNQFSLSKPKNLSIHTINPNKFIPSNKTYFFNVYRILKKLLKANKLDIIITRNTTFLPYLVKIRKQFNTPVFYETHDFFANLSIRDDINISKKDKYYKIENKYIPHISGVICLQNSQIEQYKTCFPNQTFILARTGINKLHHKTEAVESYIAYIGSLDMHKGVKLLIDATAVSKSQPHILIIGGKHQKEIEQFYNYADDKYDKTKVTITGWINKKELDKCLRQASVGAIPLQDTFFNRYITSPLKLFDFYSYGIPVISSDLPTMRELVHENKTGCFFSPGNIQEFSEKIDLLFLDKSEIKKRNRYVYKKAEELLWEKRAEILLNKFKDFI
jgi:glycosyltransferase involved in cell wall biosynthesis